MQESEAKLVIDILNKAEKQEITGSFVNLNMKYKLVEMGKNLLCMVKGEDRRGWVQYKAMYMLNEKDTEKLLIYFQMSQNKRR